MITLLNIIFSLLFYIIFLWIGLIYTATEMRWWIVSIGVIIGHIYLSFNMIGPREMGALIFLGKLAEKIESGPVFAPWPIYTIQRITKNVIQLEFGTIPETDRNKVTGGSEFHIVLEEPLRVTFGDTSALSQDDKRKYAGDPLAERITTDPRMIVRFKVADFLVLITEIGSIDEVIEQIRDTIIATYQEYAGKNVVAKAIGEIDIVNQNLTEATEMLVCEPQHNNSDSKRNWWGIDVLSVQIKNIGLPRRYNESLAERGKIKIAALAEKQKRIDEGAGTAEAEKLLREAEAVGAEKLARVAETDGGLLVLQMKALTEAIKGGNVTILPTGALEGLASALTTFRALSGKQ